MKKTTLLIVCIVFLTCFCPVKADVIDDIIESWYVPGFSGVVARVNESGEVLPENNLGMGVTFGENGTVRYYSNFYNKSKEAFENLDDQIKGVILSELKEHEKICLMYFVRDEDGIYPDFEIMNVYISTHFVSGGRTKLFGKDYRLYCLENGELIQVPIAEENAEELRFDTDSLGMYILYYNVNAYEVEFYTEYSEDRNDAFYIADDLGENEIVEFPEIPEREGYIFTGWKHNYMQGRYDTYFYIEPSNITAFDLWAVYASWCPEEEYTPLEVTLESEKIITKGKEDGAEIILTLSEGKFAETIDDDIENDWKIVGNDELSIAGVERLDDTTVKLTLSGNSSDKYKTGEMQVEFNSELYISHEGFGDNFEVHEIADIQLDENGIKKAMFISDNSITLEKQRRSNGGNGGVSSYTVKFNTNGGEEIKSKMVGRNTVVAEPEMPVREGYVFEGWYTDAELTKPYDFEAKVTDSFTLYAAWKEDESKKIVLTVGEKKAVVFGNDVTNDVAPVIRNDRVMLPVRFVAESLGAEVLWSAENPYEVKITKGDTEIVIYIGEEEALVNGEKVTLDSPAFLENDRTYLPIRFVSENLGCKVEWVQNAQEVVITK